MNNLLFNLFFIDFYFIFYCVIIMNINDLKSNMNDLKNKIQRLCVPAQLYLAISFLSIFILLFRNLGDTSVYRCGMYQVKTPINCLVFYILKIVYVLLWTYVLQYLCSKGYSNVSWFLVLMPFILMFMLIALLMFAIASKK